jgi:hypothetical protein
VRSIQSAEDEDEPEHGRYISEGEGVQEAGEALCRFIDEHKILDSEYGPRHPLVVLAFDESDVFIGNPLQQEYNAYWNTFSELRRVLRQIQKLPILSLFLSTAGHFDQFSPEIQSDPSARAREPHNRLLDPISEASFDDVAYPALKDTIKMNRVIENDWISHLGRPL